MLQLENVFSTKSLNPTHGSGWIVHSQPTKQAEQAPRIPPTAVGGSFSSDLREHVHGLLPMSRETLEETGSAFRRIVACSQDLNDPPTAVGGISLFPRTVFCRQRLNDPPTPVGGIRTPKRPRSSHPTDLNLGVNEKRSNRREYEKD